MTQLGDLPPVGPTEPIGGLIICRVNAHSCMVVYVDLLLIWLVSLAGQKFLFWKLLQCLHGE